jgi:hypothetical protein
VRQGLHAPQSELGNIAQTSAFAVSSWALAARSSAASFSSASLLARLALSATASLWRNSCKDQELAVTFMCRSMVAERQSPSVPPLHLVGLAEVL